MIERSDVSVLLRPTIPDPRKQDSINKLAEKASGPRSITVREKKSIIEQGRQQQ